MRLLIMLSGTLLFFMTYIGVLIALQETGIMEWINNIPLLAVTIDLLIPFVIAISLSGIIYFTMIRKYEIKSKI